MHTTQAIAPSTVAAYSPPRRGPVDAAALTASPDPLSAAPPQPASATPSPEPAADPVAAPSEGPLPVGMTPLVRDRATRHLAAPCLFKIEGFQLGGHFSDRLAVPALAALLDPAQSAAPPAEVVLPALDRFAVSAAVQASARWYPVQVTIFHIPEGDALRLRQLVSHAGVRLRRGTPADAAAYVQQQGPRAALLSPPTSSPDAGALLAQELLEQLGHPPAAVVLPSEAAPLADALAQRLDLPRDAVITLASPPTPGPDTIALAPTFAEVGRQGILLSPEGAAVVERARALATSGTLSAPVVAVLPDGGSRYFGWVPGWSMGD